MPTLLVTRKMSPALAARVQASVEGRRAAPGARLAPRAVSLLRLALFAAGAIAVAWLAASLRRVHLELAAERSALLERARRESASLTPEERAIAQRILPWLALQSARYEGDLIADELRSSGAFAALIARPTVYVRGPVASFDGLPRVIESASSSFNDPFVLCLNAPPAERSEKLLRAKAHAAYAARSEAAHKTSHVQRLMDALVGLPFLGSEWQGRVEAASSRDELLKLRRSFEAAPLEGAKRAARAELLLSVMDEPSDAPGPSELDGERPHEVRVGVVDLATRKVLLRLRRRVDPAWVSEATRAQFAAGIDGCALALDVHAAIAAARRP